MVRHFSGVTPGGFLPDYSKASVAAHRGEVDGDLSPASRGSSSGLNLSGDRP